MSKILIAGGAGFIGFHMLEALLHNDKNNVHIIDNLERGKIDAEIKALIGKYDIKFIKADLTSKNAFKKLDKDYDYIYDLAALIGVRNVIKRPDRVLIENTTGLFNLLEWVKSTQKKLKRFVFASTSEVYAGTSKHFGVPIPTDEKVPLCLDDIRSPRTTYALSKIAGESACYQYSAKYNVPITIVRYHNVYGPRMGYDHVIPELIIKAKNSDEFLEVFSIDHTRAFCYASDAVEATIGLAESEGAAGETVNVGNGDEEITIKNLAEKIVSLVNPKLTIKPAGVQEGSPKRRCPDITKLKRLLNYSPKMPLSEGLVKIWEWYKRQKER
ncbi:MAG: NAD-dependent epimerase/dehydratase family protein [bacterium]